MFPKGTTLRIILSYFFQSAFYLLCRQLNITANISYLRWVSSILQKSQFQKRFRRMSFFFIGFTKKEKKTDAIVRWTGGTLEVPGKVNKYFKIKIFVWSVTEKDKGYSVLKLINLNNVWTLTRGDVIYFIYKSFVAYNLEFSFPLSLPILNCHFWNG